MNANTNMKLYKWQKHTCISISVIKFIQYCLYFARYMQFLHRNLNSKNFFIIGIPFGRKADGGTIQHMYNHAISINSFTFQLRSPVQNRKYDLIFAIGSLHVFQFMSN